MSPFSLGVARIDKIRIDQRDGESGTLCGQNKRGKTEVVWTCKEEIMISILGE